MIAETLLSRLGSVKRTGVDRWLARCPAHDDKRPSLSVREIDGDRVLVHCWSGCGVGNVLEAVGLTFEALYPERLSPHAKPERRPFPAADVLRAVEWETLVVAVAASHLGNGRELTDPDRKRLLLAASRLSAAVRESGHA
jgi:hypothetical protein